LFPLKSWAEMQGYMEVPKISDLITGSVNSNVNYAMIQESITQIGIVNTYCKYWSAYKVSILLYAMPNDLRDENFFPQWSYLEWGILRGNIVIYAFLLKETI